MVRPIDANALKLRLKDAGYPMESELIDIIDSMPTIEERKRNPWELGEEYDYEGEKK